MRNKIIIILYLSINFFYTISNASETIPLNDEQKNLINDYYICEAYTQCELDILKKLLSTINLKTESYDDIALEFVDKLILVGQESDWKENKKFIENYINKSEKLDEYQIFFSSLWGWRLYSIKSIRDYKNALYFLNKSISAEGNEEMIGNAYYSLARIYDQGRAVERDNAKAIKYFFEAVKRGEHYAYGHIALKYILGDGEIKKNYDKAINFLKLANTSWVANSDISLLKILFLKKRLPNSIYEFESWILKYYKDNNNVENFILLARGFEQKGDFLNAYKYHYINTLLNNEDNASANSKYELKNYQDEILNNRQIENIKENVYKFLKDS